MIKAEKLKTYDPKKFRPGYMSIKRNGVHAIFDPKKKMFYSRTPKEIKGLEHLIEALSHISYPLVGELTIPDLDFETASGKIRSHNSTPEAVFSIFNVIIPGKEFAKKWMAKPLQTKAIKYETMIAVNNIKDFNEFYEKAIADGEEGICWISGDHIYQPGKRTWDWMKRVPLRSMEVLVVDILPGTAGKKYEYSMGKMQCSFKESNGETKEVKVGIFKDQTDEWRKDIFDNKYVHIGNYATIEFKDYSKYGIPVQPRFKAWRWDLGA